MELVVSRPEHRPALEAFLGHWNSLWVARRDALVSALEHPAVLAWTHGELRGVATFAVDGDDCELLTLHCKDRLAGVGSALLAAVEDLAVEAGCRALPTWESPASTAPGSGRPLRVGARSGGTPAAGRTAVLRRCRSS